MISLLDDALIYFALSLLLAGPVLYLIDQMLGVAFYRWQYNLRHKDPIDDSEVKGLLVYRRSAHLRFWVAVLFGLGHLVYFVAHGSNFTTQLIMDIVAFFGLFFGFNLGPVAYRLWSRRNPMIEKLDDVGSPVPFFTRMISAAGKTAVSTLSTMRAGVANPQQPQKAESKNATPDHSPAPETPRVDFRDRVRSYTRKGDAS